MHGMRPIGIFLCAAAIAAAGCATHALVPAPEAHRLAEHAATAETGGVRLVVRAQAWSAEPLRLPEHVTPLLVTVINDSERAIRVAYERFVLLGADGRRYRAFDPARMQGVVAQMVTEPVYPLYAPPAWAYGPPGWVPVPYGPFGPPYGDPVPSTLRYVRLPTVDMLREALPERVLEPGAQASGFVYFERLPAEEGERYELRADFPAVGAGRVTRVDIPFCMSQGDMENRRA
jgi:hypothetical protein